MNVAIWGRTFEFLPSAAVQSEMLVKAGGKRTGTRKSHSGDHRKSVSELRKSICEEPK